MAIMYKELIGRHVSTGQMKSLNTGIFKELILFIFDYSKFLPTFAVRKKINHGQSMSGNR